MDSNVKKIRVVKSGIYSIVLSVKGTWTGSYKLTVMTTNEYGNSNFKETIKGDYRLIMRAFNSFNDEDALSFIKAMNNFTASVHR
jgi:hypothetical protein